MVGQIVSLGKEKNYLSCFLKVSVLTVCFSESGNLLYNLGATYEKGQLGKLLAPTAPGSDSKLESKFYFTRGIAYIEFFSCLSLSDIFLQPQNFMSRAAQDFPGHHSG